MTDLERLLDALVSRVHHGILRLECDGSEWSLTWYESRGGDDDEYVRERTIWGGSLSLAETITEAIKEVSG